MMSGYARDGYLMAKTTPSTDVVDDGGKHHAKSWDLAAICKQGRMTSERRMDEFGQEPSRAVAEAVVHPLRVPPSINITEAKGQLLGQDAAIKLRPLPGATAVSQAVG